MADDSAKVVADILGGYGWDDDLSWEVDEVQDDHIYLIGLDPGETTGVAIVRIDTKAKKQLPELIFLDQVPDGRYGFKSYFQDYYLNEKTILISEKWKERNVKGADREPQYIEGSMHMLWDDSNIEYQYPDMKALIPDEFLVEQGVWTPGMRHQMDALIHILAWLRNQAGGGGQGQGGEGEGGESEGLAGAAQALVEALGGESDEKMGDQGQPTQGDGSSQDKGYEQSFESFGQDKADEKEGQGAGVGDNDEKGTGPGGESGNGDQGDADGRGKTVVKGERKARELDGVFIGFASAEAESGTGHTLLDD